jgi:hypothetical protein
MKAAERSSRTSSDLLYTVTQPRGPLGQVGRFAVADLSSATIDICAARR